MARNFSSVLFLALLVLSAFVAAQDRDDDDKVPPSNTTASGSASSPPGPAVNPQALACFQDCSKNPISKSPCAKQITPSNPIPPASCLCNDADFLRGASGCVTNKCLNFVQDVMTEVESFCGPDAFKAMQIIGGSTGAAPNSTPSGNATDAGSDSKGPKIPQDALDCFQGCSTLPIANSTCTQKIVNNATSPSACLCHDAQFLQATSGCAQNQCLKHAAFFERELQVRRDCISAGDAEGEVIN
ncbi:uncharacterized protein PSFLO_04380 [Pseudozyma flocculosa]|uniref:Extracellular membrane protein CFEM domain-containing protein n=1 Tax=Pseudozyma flocculosa TaxID=84751 RepID=A0A5C3F6M5_9BASI|nr:uncharacterized protein PSFLO_04380 [Pseudozyma flocculosa]